MADRMTPLPVDTAGEMKVTANSDSGHSTARADEAPTVSGDIRSCTCHPNDNPPRPCPRKFAYSDCVDAQDAARYRIARVHPHLLYERWEAVPLSPEEIDTAIDEAREVARAVEAGSAQHRSDVHASAAPAAAPLPQDERAAAPPSLHLAGNFRTLLRRHAQGLNEPMRGAVERAAELIDQQRASTERIQGLYAMAVRREEAVLGQLSVVRHLLQEAVEYLIDAHPNGDSEFIRACRAALSAASPSKKPFPAPGAWFPTSVLGHPMRQYEPGKWENAMWPSEQRAMCAASPAAPLPQDPMDAANRNGLAWAVSRWQDEVSQRPLVNVHRRTLDDTWRQVIRYFGGDPEKLLGPSHDDLKAKERA